MCKSTYKRTHCVYEYRMKYEKNNIHTTHEYIHLTLVTIMQNLTAYESMDERSCRVLKTSQVG